MNNLNQIYNTFPHFQMTPNQLCSPENFFPDPQNRISIIALGETYRVEFYGPGEYHNYYHETEAEVIARVKQWLEAYKEDDI